MGCPRIARVTSSEELDTMSKNNSRGIILGIRPIPRIHSLTLIISCLKMSHKAWRLTMIVVGIIIIRMIKKIRLVLCKTENTFSVRISVTEM